MFLNILNATQLDLSVALGSCSRNDSPEVWHQKIALPLKEA
jgi:hypothetical protein